MFLKNILLLLGLFFTFGPTLAQDVKTYVPKPAYALIPTVNQVLADEWPEFKAPAALCSQIEHESCIGLTHSRCWSTRAELKTAKEYGFGLLQLTIAYDANGKIRFNNFEESKKLTGFRDWKWEDRFDAYRQIGTLVAMDRNHYDWASKVTKSEADRNAFMLVSYNSGRGGLIKDMELCRRKAGCDPSQWYGNVELYSTKSRVANKGYGKSAFEISRYYPRDILHTRFDKYVPLCTGQPTEN